MDRRRQLTIIFLVVFFDLLGFGLVIPQLGVYAKLYGASGAAQGLLIASYSLMQFVFAPLLGRWSDRAGRRPVLLLSLATSLAGHVLFALSRSLPLLFASRMIDGAGGGNISTAQAYIADITEPRKRAHAMAIIGASFGLGFVLGPVIGSIAGPLGVSWWGPHGGSIAIGSLAAMASLVTLLLTIFCLPESLPVEQRGQHRGAFRFFDPAALNHAAHHPVLARLMVVFFVSVSGFSVLHAVLTYFLVDTLNLNVSQDPALAQRMTGHIFAWIGFMAILVQGGGVRPLVKRYGEAPLVVVGALLMAIALFAMPLAHSSLGLMAACTPLAVGNALCSACLPALLTLHSPAAQRGEVLGLSQSLGSLGRIIGPLAGGMLYDHGRFVPFVVGGVLCAVATVLARGVPREHPELDEEAAEVASEVVV